MSAMAGGVRPKGPAIEPFKRSQSLLSLALERCANSIKHACGGALSSRIHDELDSRKFLQCYAETAYDNPKHADDTLRADGKLIGIAHAENPKNKNLQHNLAAWMSKLALAGNAHTVRAATESYVSKAMLI